MPPPKFLNALFNRVFRFELFLLAKRLLFPGLDLHTRCRYRFLPRFFRPGPLLDTLDAGFGNGALSYAAWKLGNRVLGISFDAEQIRKARVFFAACGVAPDRLQFEVFDLRNLPKLNGKFDQIICSETLEHIRDDRAVIRGFHELLRPGGVLHLCCPYALHPEHRLGRTDGPEDGGHVRDGYTPESYKALLEPAGFEILKQVGLGSPLLARLDKILRRLKELGGDLLAFPFFLVIWPLQFLDHTDPAVPFSLYVQAVKKELPPV